MSITVTQHEPAAKALHGGGRGDSDAQASLSTFPPLLRTSHPQACGSHRAQRVCKKYPECPLPLPFTTVAGRAHFDVRSVYERQIATIHILPQRFLLRFLPVPKLNPKLMFNLSVVMRGGDSPA